MKTTVYELLGMIKDGKAPKKINYDDDIYIWNKEINDYVDENEDYGLFTNYNVLDGLNDEIEILDEPKEDKIEKITYDEDTTFEWSFGEVYDKINEIIDKLNRDKE